MNKFLLILAVFLSSCATPKPLSTGEITPYTQPGTDADAAYIQPLMNSTVKFEERIKVKYTPNDLGIQLGLEEEILKYTVSGSGVVLEANPKKQTSLVMTAWHVCETYPVGYKEEGLIDTIEIIEGKQLVISVSEKEMTLKRIVYQEKNSDTCIVEIKGYLPNHAVLADEMPPIGAYVDVVGAPEGNWGDHVVGTQRGRYQGRMTIKFILGREDTIPTTFSDFAYYGFAGVGGFSGSGIYYKGKLIGLHTAGSGRFEHSSFGPALEDIKRALYRAKLVMKYD